MALENAMLLALVLMPLPLLLLLWQFIDKYWWTPRELGAKLRKEGIQGPQPRFMIGNVLEIINMRDNNKAYDLEEINHDIVEHVLPDYHLWAKRYGKRYVYWWGTEPRIMVSEPELIREVLAKKLSQFDKSELMVSPILPLLGRGLAVVKGHEWSHHRRVVGPAFYLDKLKKMVPQIAQCTSEMLDNWEILLQERPEIEICDELLKMTGDVISHTAFGSSYAQGQKVFQLLKEIAGELKKLEKYDWLPGRRFLPLPANFRLRQLCCEMDSTLLRIINERREAVQSGGSDSFGSDLLGLMLAECGKTSFNDRIVIEECKTFYFAGHETTGTLLAWVMMLLAHHSDWQDRARAEVREVCNGDAPDSDSVNKLKLINMIVHEALRLYPPATFFHRACFEDTMLGDLFVPKGAAVTFPVIAIHHDQQLWGNNASEFDPERFKDGVSSACAHTNAFLAFSLGPRVCVGQSFALIEAKVALATILQRFAFKLSPSYRHCPVIKLVLKPLHGVPLLLEKL